LRVDTPVTACYFRFSHDLRVIEALRRRGIVP